MPVNSNAINSMSQLKIGLYVRHRVFGRGETLKIDGDVIELRFIPGVKQLSSKMCLEMGLLEFNRSGEVE